MLKAPLFVSRKEFFLSFIVVFFVAFISLYSEFSNFKKLTENAVFTGKATVLQSYLKTNIKGKEYTVFKLKLDESDAEFYTTSWRTTILPIRARVKVKVDVSKVTFIDFMKGFFAPTTALYTVYEDDPPLDITPLYRFIEEQHESEKMAELYRATFLATPISKALREDVQKWGISHLIAISGYNVGIISFMLFFILKPIYRFFQDRYFPYRNATADITMVVLVVLFAYLCLIHFEPSFLRAFAMTLLGFFFYSRGIGVVSFGMLTLASILLLSIFPKLLFSLSFWLSVAGVFYLFLFLKHFSHLKKWQLLLFIDLGVFFLMLPIVHAFFPVFTFLQLTTPITSLIFTIFYPLSLFLHLIGFGGIMDGAILRFLSVETHIYNLQFPIWLLALYITASLLAIRYKWLVYACLGFCVLSLFFIK